MDRTKYSFYKANPIFERVSKEEFDAYVNGYPRKLQVDVCGICDPPSVTFNDFELANRWPYSVVARTEAYSDDPNNYYYEPPEKRVYSVMKNFEEVYNSKTGYKEE